MNLTIVWNKYQYSPLAFYDKLIYKPTMVSIDLSRIIKKNKNKWVALSPDNKKFIASGNTLSQVLIRASKKGVKEPTVFKAPPVENLFIG